MNARVPHTDSLTTLSDQHLDSLEAETIYLLREVVANFERPALLFSSLSKGRIICVWQALQASRM